MNFESVIGLEIHSQLCTESKIFCGCSTVFGAAPNSQVCPVCLGLPGALPVLNEKAVEYAVRAVLALGCSIHAKSVFARKNYFYPDLPKGYQISQYEEPIATNGLVEYVVDGLVRKVRITRVHMEEDAGKSIHAGFPDSNQKTYVDFNRSGVPLIEIVTEPDLREPAEAASFFQCLRSVLLAIGVNDGNMEEGSLRCDANVSVRPEGEAELGVKVEIKNLNSFRFLEKALNYEIGRQVKVVTQGAKVAQETRLWDTSTGCTVKMRSKEEAHDYRYFPEPDLPPVIVDPRWCKELQDKLPELPEQRKRRFMADYNLTEQDAGLVSGDQKTADYYENVAAISKNTKSSANWISGPAFHKARILDQDVWQVLSAQSLAELILLVDTGRISSVVAKEVFEAVVETGRSPERIVEERGLSQIDDTEALRMIVSQVLRDNPGAVSKYKNGKTGTLGFLVGQVMRSCKGKANPQVVNELLKELLTD